jgi:hypothetical protein
MRPFHAETALRTTPRPTIVIVRESARVRGSISGAHDDAGPVESMRWLRTRTTPGLPSAGLTVGTSSQVSQSRSVRLPPNWRRRFEATWSPASASCRTASKRPCSRQRDDWRRLHDASLASGRVAERGRSLSRGDCRCCPGFRAARSASCSRRARWPGGSHRPARTGHAGGCRCRRGIRPARDHGRTRRRSRPGS